MDVRDAKAEYSVAEGYKQTEVGVVPSDWDVIELGELIDSLDAGVSVNSVEQEGGVAFDEAAVLKTSCVCGGVFLPSESKKIAAGDIRRARVSPLRNTIVVSRMNTPELVGECGYVTDDYPSRFLPDRLWMTRFSSDQYVNVRWLGYVLSFGEVSRKIKADATGTSGSMRNISKSSFLSVLVPYPGTEEQDAIAEYLSDVDALIESLERLIAKKRLIKQGASQDLLSGRRRLPGTNGDWGEQSFGEVFDFRSTATNSRSDLSDNGSAFYVHYGDIHTKFHSHLDVTRGGLPRIDRERCRRATSLKNGDWVMADASEDFDGVGKSVEVAGLEEGVDAVAGLHTFLLREKVKTFEPGFKGHLGNLPSLHDQFLRVATGMKVFGVSKNALKDLLLPIPPAEEQRAITAILSEMDAEIAALEKKLTKARQLKQGMMEALLTGRTRLI